MAKNNKVHNHDHHHQHHEHSHTHDHEHSHHHHQASSEGPILTVRALAGLSGDMMLSGLAGLSGISPAGLNELVAELNLPALAGCLKVEAHAVNHIAGLACRIDLPHEHAHRNMADIKKIITDSSMPAQAQERSMAAFSLLAEAEAAVHGKTVDDVTFHEVGALDSILDTCMVCRLFTLIEPARFVCSPLPLADGVIHCAHGHIASPAPAVLRLLENVPVRGFKGEGETVTPTAISLLKALGAEFGPWPDMTVQKTIISYGQEVFTDAPNGAVWALGRA